MSPIDYVIHFLLGEGFGGLRPLVGYTSDVAQYGQYRVVIVPSGFFRDGVYGTAASLPALPLPAVEGVPILYGEPRVERVGDTVVVYADVVASAYFLLSRYEEMVRRGVRDVHGRFPGRESVAARGGFIHRPEVILRHVIVTVHKCNIFSFRLVKASVPGRRYSGIFLVHCPDVQESAPIIFKNRTAAIR